MDAAKRERLEAAGFKVGSVAEFLGLSAEESAIIEMKLILSDSLKRKRMQQRLSQNALAKRLHSSQSRIAKMEAGDPGVSIDLLLRALLAAGATLEEVGEAIASLYTQERLCDVEEAPRRKTEERALAESR